MADYHSTSTWLFFQVAVTFLGALLSTFLVSIWIYYTVKDTVRIQRFIKTYFTCCSNQESHASPHSHSPRSRTGSLSKRNSEDRFQMAAILITLVCFMAYTITQLVLVVIRVYMLQNTHRHVCTAVTKIGALTYWSAKGCLMCVFTLRLKCFDGSIYAYKQRTLFLLMGGFVFPTFAYCTLLYTLSGIYGGITEIRDYNGWSCGGVYPDWILYLSALWDLSTSVLMLVLFILPLVRLFRNQELAKQLDLNAPDNDIDVSSNQSTTGNRTSAYTEETQATTDVDHETATNTIPSPVTQTQLTTVHSLSGSNLSRDKLSSPKPENKVTIKAEKRKAKSEKKESKLRILSHKYTLLTSVALCSSILSIILVALLDSAVLIALDIPVNILCVIFMSNVRFDNRYKCVCKPCRRATQSCCMMSGL